MLVTHPSKYKSLVNCESILRDVYPDLFPVEEPNCKDSDPTEKDNEPTNGHNEDNSIQRELTTFIPDDVELRAWREDIEIIPEEKEQIHKQYLCSPKQHTVWDETWILQTESLF
jgi:hypothetical protein